MARVSLFFIVALHLHLYHETTVFASSVSLSFSFTSLGTQTSPIFSGIAFTTDAPVLLYRREPGLWTLNQYLFPAWSYTQRPCMYIFCSVVPFSVFAFNDHPTSPASCGSTSGGGGSTSGIGFSSGIVFSTSVCPDGRTFAGTPNVNAVYKYGSAQLPDVMYTCEIVVRSTSHFRLTGLNVPDESSSCGFLVVPLNATAWSLRTNCTESFQLFDWRTPGFDGLTASETPTVFLIQGCSVSNVQYCNLMKTSCTFCASSQACNGVAFSASPFVPQPSAGDQVEFASVVITQTALDEAAVRFLDFVPLALATARDELRKGMMDQRHTEGCGTDYFFGGSSLVINRLDYREGTLKGTFLPSNASNIALVRVRTVVDVDLSAPISASKHFRFIFCFHVASCDGEVLISGPFFVDMKISLSTDETGFILVQPDIDVDIDAVSVEAPVHCSGFFASFFMSRIQSYVNQQVRDQFVTQVNAQLQSLSRTYSRYPSVSIGFDLMADLSFANLMTTTGDSSAVSFRAQVSALLFVQSKLDQRIVFKPDWIPLYPPFNFTPSAFEVPLQIIRVSNVILDAMSWVLGEYKLLNVTRAVYPLDATIISRVQGSVPKFDILYGNATENAKLSEDRGSYKIDLAAAMGAADLVANCSSTGNLASSGEVWKRVLALHLDAMNTTGHVSMIPAEDGCTAPGDIKIFAELREWNSTSITATLTAPPMPLAQAVVKALSVSTANAIIRGLNRFFYANPLLVPQNFTVHFPGAQLTSHRQVQPGNPAAGYVELAFLCTCTSSSIGCVSGCSPRVCNSSDQAPVRTETPSSTVPAIAITNTPVHYSVPIRNNSTRYLCNMAALRCDVVTHEGLPYYECAASCSELYFLHTYRLIPSRNCDSSDSSDAPSDNCTSLVDAPQNHACGLRQLGDSLMVYPMNLTGDLSYYTECRLGLLTKDAIYFWHCLYRLNLTHAAVSTCFESPDPPTGPFQSGNVSCEEYIYALESCTLKFRTISFWNYGILSRRGCIGRSSPHIVDDLAVLVTFQYPLATSFLSCGIGGPDAFDSPRDTFSDSAIATATVLGPLGDCWLSPSNGQYSGALPFEDTFAFEIILDCNGTELPFNGSSTLGNCTQCRQGDIDQASLLYTCEKVDNSSSRLLTLLRVLPSCFDVDAGISLSPSITGEFAFMIVPLVATLFTIILGHGCYRVLKLNERVSHSLEDWLSVLKVRCISLLHRGSSLPFHLFGKPLWPASLATMLQCSIACSVTIICCFFAAYTWDLHKPFSSIGIALQKNLGLSTAYVSAQQLETIYNQYDVFCVFILRVFAAVTSVIMAAAFLGRVHVWFWISFLMIALLVMMMLLPVLPGFFLPISKSVVLFLPIQDDAIAADLTFLLGVVYTGLTSTFSSTIVLFWAFSLGIAVCVGSSVVIFSFAAYFVYLLCSLRRPPERQLRHICRDVSALLQSISRLSRIEGLLALAALIPLVNFFLMLMPSLLLCQAVDSYTFVYSLTILCFLVCCFVLHWFFLCNLAIGTFLLPFQSKVAAGLQAHLTLRARSPRYAPTMPKDKHVAREFSSDDSHCTVETVRVADLNLPTVGLPIACMISSSICGVIISVWGAITLSSLHARVETAFPAEFSAFALNYSGITFIAISMAFASLVMTHLKLSASYPCSFCPLCYSATCVLAAAIPPEFSSLFCGSELHYHMEAMQTQTSSGDTAGSSGFSYGGEKAPSPPGPAVFGVRRSSTNSISDLATKNNHDNGSDGICSQSHCWICNIANPQPVVVAPAPSAPPNNTLRQRCFHAFVLLVIVVAGASSAYFATRYPFLWILFSVIFLFAALFVTGYRWKWPGRKYIRWFCKQLLFETEANKHPVQFGLRMPERRLFLIIGAVLMLWIALHDRQFVTARVAVSEVVDSAGGSLTWPTKNGAPMPTAFDHAFSAYDGAISVSQWSFNAAVAVIAFAVVVELLSIVLFEGNRVRPEPVLSVIHRSSAAEYACPNAVVASISNAIKSGLNAGSVHVFVVIDRSFAAHIPPNFSCAAQTFWSTNRVRAANVHIICHDVGDNGPLDHLPSPFVGCEPVVYLEESMRASLLAAVAPVYPTHYLAFTDVNIPLDLDGTVECILDEHHSHFRLVCTQKPGGAGALLASQILCLLGGLFMLVSVIAPAVPGYVSRLQLSFFPACATELDMTVRSVVTSILGVGVAGFTTANLLPVLIALPVAISRSCSCVVSMFAIVHESSSRSVFFDKLWKSAGACKIGWQSELRAVEVLFVFGPSSTMFFLILPFSNIAAVVSQKSFTILVFSFFLLPAVTLASAYFAFLRRKEYLLLVPCLLQLLICYLIDYITDFQLMSLFWPVFLFLLACAIIFMSSLLPLLSPASTSASRWLMISSTAYGFGAPENCPSTLLDPFDPGQGLYSSHRMCVVCSSRGVLRWHTLLSFFRVGIGLILHGISVLIALLGCIAELTSRFPALFSNIICTFHYFACLYAVGVHIVLQFDLTSFMLGYLREKWARLLPELLCEAFLSLVIVGDLVLLCLEPSAFLQSLSESISHRIRALVDIVHRSKPSFLSDLKIHLLGNGSPILGDSECELPCFPGTSDDCVSDAGAELRVVELSATPAESSQTVLAAVSVPASSDPACFSCGNPSAPFCAATGKPHEQPSGLIPTCVACGNPSAPFCAATGKPHI